MAFRPPNVLESLMDLELPNGNVHRVQIVTFGQPPNGVVGLECREYISPDNLMRMEPGAVPNRDEEGWGLGLNKILRTEHLEWLFENREQVQHAVLMARRQLIDESLDAWGRPVK